MKARLLAAFLVSVSLLCSCATSDDFGPPTADNNDDGQTNGTSGPKGDCIAPPCADDDSECIDADGDGYGVGCANGVDCNDEDPVMSPGRTERCDNKDNDCNGLVDDRPDCDGSCIDMDGDGYGEGCPNGTDCDDSDPEKFDGAPEACDDKDNNCNGTVDEGFDLGADCSNGLGICAADGVNVCTEDGTGVECGAEPGPSEVEVCDELDNDCDGVVNNGLNCPDCVDDQYEPNDGSGDATSLTSGSKSAQLCGGSSEADWYFLGDYNVGDTITVRITFSHAQADLDLDLYSNFAFDAASASETDDEAIVNHQVGSTGPVHARVYWPPNYTPPDSGNSYTISR